MSKINYKRHIYEGWTVRDFIIDLDVIIGYQSFRNKQELKEWCKDNQPFYKKHIPEVVNHYANKFNLK